MICKFLYMHILIYIYKFLEILNLKKTICFGSGSKLYVNLEFSFWYIMNLISMGQWSVKSLEDVYENNRVKILIDLRSRLNDCHSPDNIFKCIFLKENFCVLIQISLMWILKCPIDCKAELVVAVARHWKGNRPLPQPMVTTIIGAVWYGIIRPQCWSCAYRKISKISCTKSQNLNDSPLVLQLSLPNPLRHRC